MTTRSELETLTRDGLIERARRLGVPRPEVMTRVEMTDEIIRRQETDAAARRRARGWLGVARDLVASLIEQGLNMPDAAELVRQGVTPTRVQHQPPVATVTLAEIYAAQGHLKRALGMLDQVLEKEPDHAAARALRDRLGSSRPAPVRAVEPEQPELDAAPPPEPVPEPVPVPEPEPEPEPVPEPEPEPVPEPEPEPVPVPEPAAEPVPVAAPFHAHPPSDVLVLVAGPGGVSAFWELSDRTRAQKPEVVLRVSAVSPGFRGARKSQRDLALDTPAGSLALRGLGAGAVVRAALGFERGGEFAPLVVASVIGGDGSDLAFTPLAGAAPDGRTLERAREACARVAT